MPSPVHLVVLVHGLWGQSSHLSVLEEELLAHHPSAVDASSPLVHLDPPSPSSSASSRPNPRDAQIVVLNVKGNSGDKTYDGIDVCSARVVEEIDLELERLSNDEKKVVFFSMSGYSLGGLVARHALGILHARDPSFFTNVKPLCFSTFASPWLGMPRYNTLFNSFATTVGSKMLSRTGAQLFVTDEEQLVVRLAGKDDVFMQALMLFSKIDIYANAVHDKTVPYVTGSASLVDPFEKYETNGIDIKTHPDLPIIESYQLPPTAPLPAQKPWYRSLTSRSSIANSPATSGSSTPPLAYPDQRGSSLPPWLRFRFPLNILFFLVFPFVAPVFIGMVLFRFGSEGRRSRQRLRGKESETLWERLKDVERRVEREFMSSGAAAVDEAGGEDEEEVERMTDGERRGKEREAMDVKVGKDGGRQKKKKKVKRGEVMLTDAQIACVKALDSLPQLKRHLVWFPYAFNSHAMIISRDPVRFPDHGQGRLVLRHWVERMLQD